jgi:protein SCO1/2
MSRRFQLLALLALLGCRALDARATTARDVQQRVGLDQHLGRVLPDSILLSDAQGQQHSLGDSLRGKPAVLALVYFECPNLCTLTLTGLLSSLDRVDLTAGRDFEVIAVSIDPRDTPDIAQRKQAAYIARYKRAQACKGCDAGWHLLTGTPDQVAALARAVGFRYFWDASQSQYAHPAGLIILTPKRRISQYFNGVVFPPAELRQALQVAAIDHTGSLAEKLWLLCYHYDALVGRYSAQITAALRIFGLALIVALAVLITRLVRSTP